MQIPFHKAFITDEEIKEVTDTIKSGWITMGPKVIKFENEFTDYISEDKDKKYRTILVNSCTAALHLSLKAIGIKEGDEVILPTNTFIATAEVVTYFGAVPVLCDIEYDTHNIDVSKIEKLITDKTKAIIPVHFAGQPCDLDEIKQLADKYKLKIIEDAAHAFPSKYKGKYIGTTGNLTCFSYYATKTLAMGEGGAVTLPEEQTDMINKIKINRLHGISRDAWDRYTLKGSWYYEVIDNGLKYNSTDINAALGLIQLKNSNNMLELRKNIAKLYNESIGTKFEPLLIKDDRETSWHLYVIKVNNRNDLIEKLKEEGIGTSVHFIPVHKHPYYKNKYNLVNEDYPVANEVFEKSISLPIYPGMTYEQVNTVVEKVLKYAR